ISHYHYVWRTPRHCLYAEVTSRRMDVREYVESGISRELDNGQTYLLAGKDVTDPQDLRSPELLEEAKRNVSEHFALVGLTERFDESLLLAKEILGWTRPLPYARRNVTARRPRAEELPAGTVEVIQAHNELDAELYRFARERLDSEVASRGPAFQRRLRTLRLVNAGLGRIPSGLLERSARLGAALRPS